MRADQKTSSLKQAFEFIPQVRQEVRKVTWPTRRETLMTTAFVFGFAVIAAIYFMLVDQVVFRLVNFILGFGS
ncbi:MAG: preprotein translocase subunit SecE [Alphaproteobacteria bacterium]|jgi:preprotein translocase subunit SecE|nr:preprotein translocase subunit SecE [Alphaproteobacteria bacterium]